MGFSSPPLTHSVTQSVNSSKGGAGAAGDVLDEIEAGCDVRAGDVHVGVRFRCVAGDDSADDLDAGAAVEDVEAAAVKFRFVLRDGAVVYFDEA